MNMKCPNCNEEFKDYVELKTKPNVYLCEDCGLFSKTDDEWSLTEFPCPECEGNYKTPKRYEDGEAVCECEIHGTFKANAQLSLNFRRLCSKVAQTDTRSPSYYTTPEEKIKGYLDRRDIEYKHNYRIYNEEKEVYYWLDFYIPKTETCIEVSPDIWHSRWNRQESEKEEEEFLSREGIEEITLTDDDMNQDYLVSLFNDLEEEYEER